MMSLSFYFWANRLNKKRMFPKTVFVFWLVVITTLTACTTQQATPPPGSIMTTPVDDLPVSIGNTNTSIELPTPVADAVIQEADADYLVLSNVYERSAPAVVNIEAVTL